MASDPVFPSNVRRACHRMSSPAMDDSDLDSRQAGY
jgi:hypothetical protein